MRARASSLLLATLSLVAASCRSAEPDPIRIGVLADCEGYAATFYEVALAGAELPLLARGGSLRGTDPSGGVDGVSVSGRPVELAFGCSPEPISSVVEARRLVEGEGVDVLIGPNVFPSSPGLTDYAGRQPDTTFVVATGERLTDPAPAANVFRLTPEFAQTVAGLGAYAFQELGWRRAMTLAGPDWYGWGLHAGFVGEFCSLGGSIMDRVWIDVVPEDLPALIADIDLDVVDGYFLGTDVFTTAAFLERFADQRRDLGRSVIATPAVLDQTIVSALGDRLLGVAVASFVPLDASRPEWNAYAGEFTTAFPELADTAVAGGHFYDIDYHNAMEAVLRALEAVDGDLTDGGARFRAELAETDLEAPSGRLALDETRQAIVPIYLSRVEADAEGNLVFRTFRTIEDVDPTVGGILGPTDPPPDRTHPACEPGDPPPWAPTG